MPNTPAVAPIQTGQAGLESPLLENATAFRSAGFGQAALEASHSVARPASAYPPGTVRTRVKVRAESALHLRGALLADVFGAALCASMERGRQESAPRRIETTKRYRKMSHSL